MGNTNPTPPPPIDEDGFWEWVMGEGWVWHPYTDADRPPGRTPPADGDNHQWYLREIASKPDRYDTNISEAQWIAWRPFWDDATKTFRSENVDASGNPISGTGFEKPVDCPEGTTKYSLNQCLPLDDPRITGAGGGGGGTGGGATGQPAQPPKSESVASSQLQYTGDPLMDSLVQMFNYRAGVFGTGNPFMSGATPRTSITKDKKGKQQEIEGVFLPGGGLWWGDKGDLSTAIAPLAKMFAPAGGVKGSNRSSDKTLPGGGVPWDNPRDRGEDREERRERRRREGKQGLQDTPLGSTSFGGCNPLILYPAGHPCANKTGSSSPLAQSLFGSNLTFA